MIGYGNEVSIDTDNVTYIENGPNYHTYTFIITRAKAPADAPLENLVLSPLTDGTYRELLFTYSLTSSEKQMLENGLPVETKGKVNVTELTKGTYNNGGQLAKTSCNWTERTVWISCSEGLHSGSNFSACRFITHPEEGTPPRAYTVEEYRCLSESDPGSGEGGGGSTGGGSSSSGSGGDDNTPCNGNGVLTGPQQPGITDPNGCTGIPTMPTLPLPNTPCRRIISENQKAKEYYNKAKFQSKLAEAKATITTDTQEKGFSFGVKDGEEAVTNVKTGSNGNSVDLDVQSPALTVYGAGHTHNKGSSDEPSPPSFEDVYLFLQAHNGIPGTSFNGNPNFKYLYTFTHDGNEYVFTITNPTDFKNFMGLYPPNEYINPNTHIWDLTKSIGIDADGVNRYFNDLGKTISESYELASAFILTKYNSGMGFSKKDGNGDFKPIFVKEISQAGKKTYEKTNDCNLK
ncbi:hypothetical protein [Chryseobacterium indoltheticum]|uniref:Uncharacterized protein n=1 Tax=Chryseobacterium indoltheticum TaxID=254 RepID=A0A381FA06_9FLAO|nr:hypothetical protein [Chryseobacterium indoltheticum]AZA73454.1 hypothetical protein EG358_06645 [Chryseobacterium indoltheticum]SIR02042.1 hypothetical protein SAMN05421682_11176 [Chryseobacterium indoltheticum]SUX43298.1 Uncharacterised protein [Chryseobacterium indoltheticum]